MFFFFWKTVTVTLTWPLSVINAVLLQQSHVEIHLDLNTVISTDDEIIEWNEQSLVDCTAEEVHHILAMDDSLDLHLVLSRFWYVIYGFRFSKHTVCMGLSTRKQVILISSRYISKVVSQKTHRERFSGDATKLFVFIVPPMYFDD